MFFALAWFQLWSLNELRFSREPWECSQQDLGCRTWLGGDKARADGDTQPRQALGCFKCLLSHLQPPWAGKEQSHKKLEQRAGRIIPAAIPTPFCTSQQG